MARINKPALVEELMLHNVFENATKTQVTAFVEDFFNLLAGKVIEGNELTIPNFGKFERYEKQDGTFKPKFTPYKDFKEAVKAGK